MPAGLYTNQPPADFDDVPAMLEGQVNECPPTVWDLESLWWWEFTATETGDYTFDTVETDAEGQKYAVLADIRQVETGAPPWQQMFAGWEPPVAPGEFLGETGFTVLRLTAGTRIRVGFVAYSTEDGETPSATIPRTRVRRDGAAEQPREFRHIGTNSGTSSPMGMPPGAIPGDWLMVTMTGVVGPDGTYPSADCERVTLDEDHPYMDISTVVTRVEWEDGGPVTLHVTGRIREDIERAPSAVYLSWPTSSAYNQVAVTVFRVRSGNQTGTFQTYTPFYVRTLYPGIGEEILRGVSWSNILPIEYDEQGYVKLFRAPDYNPAAGIDAALATFVAVDAADFVLSMLTNPAGVQVLNGGSHTHAVALSGDLTHTREAPNGGEAPGSYEATVYGIRLDTDWWWVPPYDPPPVRLYPRDDGRGMSAAPRLWPPSKARRVVGGHR